jgi:PKHD-type hydroxylase
MRIAIANILPANDLSAVREVLAVACFVDGKQSAGFAARTVKANQQADPTDRRLDGVRALVAKQIMSNDVFQIAARPKQLGPLLFSRYDVGMQYGVHVDNALMEGMRTDAAFTLFLSDPEDYDGGELVIQTADGDEAIKLPAGSMIVYPATSLHRVERVTRGVRYAVAGWARSFIRDASQRELLFDLDTARRAIFAREGKSTEFDLISKTLANLMRMWADD